MRSTKNKKHVAIHCRHMQVHDTKCFNRAPNTHSLHAVETFIRSDLIPRLLIRVWVYISGQLETLLHTSRDKPIATHYVLLKLFLEVISFSGFHVWHYIRGQPPETLLHMSREKPKLC